MVSRQPTMISLFQRPDVIADASLHRRRDAQGLMDAGDAGEVVPVTTPWSAPRHLPGLYRCSDSYLVALIASVQLDQHRVVHVDPKRAFHGAQVAFVTVRS